jgi:hypothetical protein
VVLGGAVLSYSGGGPNRWNQEVYATVGECVRLDVVTESVDMNMTVTAPDGRVYFNEDKGPSNKRPRVEIASAPNTGWYNVSVGPSSGASGDARFAMSYGRYSAGNPNCANATPASTLRR